MQQAQSATWSPTGTIVFGAQEGPLRQVPAAGGTPQPLTQLDASRQETSHRHPYFLPDGRHFLYLARSVIPDQRGVYVGGLDGSTPKKVLSDDSNAIYFAGHLLFVRGTTLIAQPFEPVGRQVSGMHRSLRMGEPWSFVKRRVNCRKSGLSTEPEYSFRLSLIAGATTRWSLPVTIAISSSRFVCRIRIVRLCACWTSSGAYPSRSRAMNRIKPTPFGRTMDVGLRSHRNRPESGICTHELSIDPEPRYLPRGEMSD